MHARRVDSFTLVSLAFHRTDIHISFLSLALALTIHNKQNNQLHELSFVWGEDASNVVVIPTQHRVTEQILSRWQTFKDLKQTLVVSRRAEQLRLRVQ